MKIDLPVNKKTVTILRKILEAVDGEELIDSITVSYKEAVIVGTNLQSMMFKLITHGNLDAHIGPRKTHIFINI